MLPKARIQVLFPVLFILLAAACGGDYYPKPHGHFRIDLPEKEYVRFDTTFPYSFDYPVYARVTFKTASPEEAYWSNVEFPRFRGKVHLSYKEVSDNLNEYIEDSRTMAMKHIPKASGIRPESYVTDSTRHFVRGALYFSGVPNNDYLAPVIGFLEEDIRHLIETFQWKDVGP